MAFRAGADLSRARAYARVKRTLDPIADDIDAQLPDLEKLAADCVFRQPALNGDALATRLAHGCRNVQEKGLLVTRNFARYLGEVDVHFQDCVMAQLRFLTVRRYVTLDAGVGTCQALRYPQVPQWDEQRFPVNPPKDFINWIDPLWLGSEWNVVVVCGQCGGSGRVLEHYQEAKTEYYTDHQGRSQSRTVYVTKSRWVTCPRCGGCGRLLHQQILNTQWQRLQPTVTTPEMRMAELVEDAEEVTFAHLPVKENRHLVSAPKSAAAPTNAAIKRLAQAARALAALHSNHARAVEQLHDARLYRADFRVCGFRTIRMTFRRLGSRVGWFFGKRPEFFFPRLPLSWATLGTFVFLPPLALAIGLVLTAAAAALLS
jgi:hypothetical protein